MSTTSSSGTSAASTTSTSTTTSTTTTASTTTTGIGSSEADDGCYFIPCVDMGGPNLIPCDPFVEQPCPVGMKCTYDHHPKGGSFVCGEQIGEDGLFEPCELNYSPADTCAPGLTCQPASACGDVERCCTPICDPVDGDPPCPDPAPQCVELYGAGYCDA